MEESKKKRKRTATDKKEGAVKVTGKGGGVFHTDSPVRLKVPVVHPNRIGWNM